MAAWQAGRTPSDVADALGLPVDELHRRAMEYRRAGVALKHLPPRSPKRLDVDGLNQLILDIEAGRAAVPPDPEAEGS